MPDNTILNTGAGGDTIASDDIGGVKFQRVKIVEGADGINDGDVSASNPLPVEIIGTPTVTANAGTGTLAVSGPLTDAQLRATAVPISGTVTASGPLTDTQLRATAVPISGTVTANAGTGTLATNVAAATAATLANVASSASNGTLLASNTSRRGAMVHNDSTQVLYLKYGATASTTSYTVKVPADGYFEFPAPTYTGIVDGIWAAANGNARLTEIT